MLTLAAAYLLRAAGGSIGGMLPLAFGVILVALAIAFALLDLPQWMRDLSPYTHVPPLAGEGKVTPVLAVLAEASALGLAGLLTLRRRDLAVS